MDQHLSWGKAYIVSAILHLVLFGLLALGLAVVVAQQEQQLYVIDLSTSDFNQGSGHEGGGSNESLFPEPLKAEEVAKRVEAVQQTMPSPVTTNTPVTAPTPDAVTLPTQGSPTASPDAAASGSDAGSNTGGDTGTGGGKGGGEGDKTGDGRGTGDGSGTQKGTGDGNVAGTGNTPFDRDGFWAAVNANKQYPYMAIKRRLEGTATIVTTISPSGAITGVSLQSSSGHGMLDDAAVAAARAVGSYPNPTGATVTVTTNVSFSIQ